MAVRDLHFIVVIVAPTAVVGMVVVVMVVVQGVGVAAATGRMYLVAADFLVKVLKRTEKLITLFLFGIFR